MQGIQPTSNYIKHTSKNPLQKFLVNKFYEELIDLVKPIQPKIILDAGCGEGFSINRLHENKIGEKLEGIDDSKIALANGKKLFPYLKIKIGNIQHLPYKDNSFDLVLCTEVLEHLQNPSLVLKEILRVSSKYIIISVPNDPYFTIQRFLRGKNIMRLGVHPEHIQHWTSEGFELFLKKEGVKVLEKRVPLFWTIILGQK